MSREVYGSLSQTQRSPKPTRRSDITTHGQSTKYYTSTSISQPVSTHGSPITSRTVSSEPRKGRHYGVSRSSNASPLTLPADTHVPHSISTSAFNVSQSGYYADDLGSPTMDGRSGGPAPGSGHHRSRSATRVPLRNYHSLERDQEREFVPIREPRERSLDRTDVSSRHPRSRERSLDRSGYRDRDERDHVTYRDLEGAMDTDPYRDSGHMSRTTHSAYGDSRHNYSSRGDSFVMELQARLNEVQNQYGNLKREMDATTQKLGSSMHSIKTFWSPELKKERALRKEEAAKYALINDQLKILRSENQKQAALIRQLEEELRIAHLRNPDAEVQQHLEALYNEKEHMTKEIYLLRETIKELEMRIETQKQTLAARDESIKKLMEIKGVGGKLMEEERLEVERMKGKLIETESRSRHLETMLESRDKDLSKMEELRIELNRRDQEIMAMGAKMKTLEEQHHDYQRHIAVLKESLCAKEEHYNMLQADVEELRVRLEEKNKLIEKKTQQTMSSTQERNRLTQEVQELRDHMEIKDRKINVLQRKIENLEDLLKEKDNQVDMARARLTAMQAHHSSSEGALSSLEEAIGDKDKQISQLREQRDRAEQEKNEERELHERDIAEYKMKTHGMESEMEKLQADLQSLRSQKRPSMQESQQVDVVALHKQVDEKQKILDEMEKRFKKGQDKIKQLETQLQQTLSGKNEGAQKQVMQLQEQCKELANAKEQALEEAQKFKENASHSQAELERLLQIMSTVEEEKFALNKQIKDLQDLLKEKDSKLQGVKRSQQADKTKSAQMMEEARRRETEASKETSKAQEQVLQQQERIEELEEALRESVHITAEREVAVAQKISLIKAAEEKISSLQAEVRALQNAYNARCTNCPPMKVKVSEMEKKLQKLVSERRQQLEQLFEMKQEALSAAISEKDAHLAVLEVSGIKNAKTAEEADRLKAEKRRLVERIKTENENRVKLLLELGESTVDSNGKVEEKTVTNSRDAEEDGLRSIS